MEMKFREAGHLSQLLQFQLAIQIRAKIVDDPINSLGIFAVGLGHLAGHVSFIRRALYSCGRTWRALYHRYDGLCNGDNHSGVGVFLRLRPDK